MKIKPIKMTNEQNRLVLRGLLVGNLFGILCSMLIMMFTVGLLMWIVLCSLTLCVAITILLLIRWVDRQSKNMRYNVQSQRVSKTSRQATHLKVVPDEKPK